MPIIGLLRIRNEVRWIETVVRAITPVCEHVLVLDNDSDDGTADVCRSIPGVTVYDFATSGINASAGDESAGKDWLLSKAYELVPEQYKCGNPVSPWFGLMVDGDEALMPADQETVRDMARRPEHAWHFRIPYAWNDENTYRVDGVYSRMAELGRPSMFRLMNESFRFQKTRFGKDGQNFHCSSVPQEMLHHARPSTARLKHFGYMHAEDRIRKYHWYNERDPENRIEDGYRHMVIGDLFPATSRFIHAGPLELRPL